MAFLFCMLFVVSSLMHVVTSVPTTQRRSTIDSVLDPRVSISYKRTHICETTPGVQSYSGYINLPADPNEGRHYDIHTFFWFFEARKDPANAPLSIWLQGGPGSPSVTAALGLNGPCLVAKDSKATTLNPWSWNNEVNMLYIDQPVQVGFSYDRLANGTVDEIASPFNVTLLEAPSDYSEASEYILAGTFASQDTSSTANTTLTAARAAWNFMQVWIQEFPVYKPKNNTFSIWGESYAGHYVPTFADFFESQNKLIERGEIDSSAIKLHLDTVGIMNGCIDTLTEMPMYPHMAYNNTYGIQAINETQYQAAVDSFPPCREAVKKCQSLADEKDSFGAGNNNEVNTACKGAYELCFGTMWSGYGKSGLNPFDVTTKLRGFPPKYAAGFLNSGDVQSELGVPLNFTGYSDTVEPGFMATGDMVAGRNLAILGNLLDRDVKVALVYGDRDYQCNWLGGEQVSLAIDSRNAAEFHKAGYAKIETNANYIGGRVRQYGDLSFSRVFDAGHEVPWYQPETAYRIFKRIMSNTDVATGKHSTKPTGHGIYSTEGPSNIFGIKNALPATPPQTPCYLWDILETCTGNQKRTMLNGTATWENFILVE